MIPSTHGSMIEPDVTRDLIVMPCPFRKPPLTKNALRRMRPILQSVAIGKIRTDAHWVTKAMLPRARRAGWVLPDPGPVTIRLVRTVTTRLRADASGGQPTLEAWIDGMTVGTVTHPGAGLLTDDNFQVVQLAYCEFELGPVAGCRVEIARA